jgi:hypothetical protein
MYNTKTVSDYNRKYYLKNREKLIARQKNNRKEATMIREEEAVKRLLEKETEGKSVDKRIKSDNGNNFIAFLYEGVYGK